MNTTNTPQLSTYRTTNLPTLNTKLSEAIDFYIEQEAQFHKAYLHSEQYRYNSLKKYLGKIRLKDISPEKITSFIKTRLQVVKQGTAKRDVCALQRCLNWLRKDFCLRLPDHFQHVRLPSDTEIRQFIPTDAEVEQVIDLLPSDVKPVIALLAETACRRSEVLNLTIHDLNLDKRYFTLQTTKNGSSRMVPLSLKAVSILEDAASRGKSKLFSPSPERVTKQFRLAADKLDLHSFVVHSLRHYKLSKLVMAGHDYMLIAGVSGHKDIRMLRRYVKHDVTKLASMMD